MPFHTVHWILKARILKWFAIPSPVDHVLSELSTMTHLSWVALHCMAHTFIELDAGQEETVRTGHGTTDWFQVGKGVRQACRSPCLFNLYAEYIMRNPGWNQDCREKYQ